LNIIRDKHSLVYKFLLYVFCAVVTAWFLPSVNKYSVTSLKGLSAWPYEELKAQADVFVKKDEKRAKAEQEELINASPLYFKISEGEKERNLTELKAIVSKGNDEVLSTACRLLDTIYSKGVIEKVPEPEQRKALYVVRNGIAEQSSYFNFYTLDQAVNYFEKALKDHPAKEKIIEQCVRFLALTVFMDKTTTQKYLTENLAGISLFKSVFKKGETLIRTYETITPEKREVLETYFKQERGEEELPWLNLAGRLLLAFTLFGILMLYLSFFRKAIFGQNTHVTFLFLIIVISTIASAQVAPHGILLFWALPFALVPVLVRIFFDSRTALFTFLICILISSFHAADKFQFMYVQLIAGMGTVFSVAEMRKRKELLFSAIVVFAFYIAAYVSYHLVNNSEKILYQKVFYLPFILSSLLILLAYPFIFLAEKLFGFISDFTLMELCDLNAPLLRELSQKVPGTFQHSLQVANLAEEAIFHIGGNSLLVRAGAMYHDIGKMENPRYFTENQAGELNPHSEILPEESAKIIISHVIKGVEKAKSRKLPEQIIDFIRTHHGTTTVGFFLNNFKKEHSGEKINEDAFKYPGPIPFSKETAVLMMADGVEAASRSLKKYDALSINDLVDRIIDYKINENQFINADITFKDITIVKKIFKKRLMNMYHVRIEYPR
jgi:cyclic-di-AMP phosphodiesterase PgpH